MNVELERLFASAQRVESYLRSGLVTREVAYAQLMAIQAVDDAGRVWVVLPHEGVLRPHLVAPGRAPVLAEPGSFTIDVKPSFSVWKTLRRFDAFPSSAVLRAAVLLVGFGALLVWMLPAGHSKGLALLHQDPPTVLQERCEGSCSEAFIVVVEDSRVAGEASLVAFCASAIPQAPQAIATDLGGTVECRFSGCAGAADGGDRRCLTTRFER